MATVQHIFYPWVGLAWHEIQAWRLLGSDILAGWRLVSGLVWGCIALVGVVLGCRCVSVVFVVRRPFVGCLTSLERLEPS